MNQQDSKKVTTPFQKAIDQIFDAQKKFIILGLTGRTGSGCTTIAEALSSKNFDDFHPPASESPHFSDDEERKYSICHSFLKKNWGRFEHIQVRNLIATFILEEDFKAFSDFIKRNTKPELKFQAQLESSIKNDFDAIKEEYSKFKDYLEDKLINDPSKKATEEAYMVFFEKIPEFTKKIKESLNNIEPNLYTSLFQIFGKNIRSSGKAYSDEFSEKNMFCLSNRANKLIKILRKKPDNGRVFVCIDAIRNPFEALFFKLRYSSFYLLSITANDTDRSNRLRSSNISDDDIKNINNTENPGKLKEKDFFISQNIPKCTQIADIHIYNSNDKKDLKKQLVRYLSLMMHPGIITPNKRECCMQIAYNAKLNSGCISRQVGAVVADEEYAIKSVGWNDTPLGQTPCSLRSASDLIASEDEKAFSEYEFKDPGFMIQLKKVYQKQCTRNGTPLCFCFKDIRNSIEKEKNQVHTRALHAEENAFLQISKSGGESIKNGILFTTASPCELCSKKAYQLGIKKIYYIDPYPGIAEDQILKSGTNRPELILFTGAIGRAHQQLFEPLMSYKEELEISEGLKIPNAKAELEIEINKLKARIAELEASNKASESQYTK
ncbi:hypothetical protein [Leptothrix ochracea]|uniref:hypothetical protein n=1 Tax=Leptothrix ochracea TaxID=735331 RepID=UPI0034E285F7